MSRSGYTDDVFDDAQQQWAHIRWRGQVASAFRGKRGQAFLRECIAALEALPQRKLAGNSFAEGSCEHQNFCTLGAVGFKRGVDMSLLQKMAEEDDDVSSEAAAVFDVARAMVAEIMYVNDEYGPPLETREQRWQRMHRWLFCQLIEWEE